MNALRFTALALSSRVATLVGIWALLISPAMAQVNGPGPIVFGTVVALCCFVIARMGFRRLVRQRL